MKILGTGSYVPTFVETNFDLINRGIKTSNEWILSKTGIEERPISDIPVSEMSKIACEKALHDAGVAAEEIDLIILATSTPDMLIPCCASSIQNKIKAYNSAAFDLNNACSGFVYSIDIASKYIESKTYKKIIVIGSDWSSKITNQNDKNTVIFFADGAGAVVLGDSTSDSKLLASHLGCSGNLEPICIPSGGCLKRFPNSNDEEMSHFYLNMKGKEIWNFVIDIVPKTIKILCEKANLKPKDIDWIIPHQANKKMIEESIKKLDFPTDRVIINVDKKGNTISGSIPIALDEANKNSKLKRGQIVALIGFGAGLSWGGNLLIY